MLQQAFIRRSYSKEYGGEDNEVLELIGDKVLDLIVVKLLTEKYGCFISDYEDFNPNEEFDEFEQEYDADGNPIWKSTCHITEITTYFCAKSSSKKYAKKQAAYQMLMYTLL